MQPLSHPRGTTTTTTTGKEERYTRRHTRWYTRLLDTPYALPAVMPVPYLRDFRLDFLISLSSEIKICKKATIGCDRL